MSSEPRQTPSERLASAAWWCVLAIAAVGPVLSANLTAFGMKYPLMLDQHLLLRAVLVAVAAFAASGFASLANRDGRMLTSVHRWPIMGFIALAALSTAFSEWRGLAFVGDYAHYEGFVMLLAYVSLMVAVTQVVTERRLRQFGRVCTAAGGLASVYGLAQMLGWDPANWLTTTFTLTRAFSMWGNPDFFGAYLIVPLSFSAVIALTDDSVMWRRVAAGCFGLIVLSLIGTVTRGAWLAAGVSLAIIAFALTKAGHRPVRWQAVAILIGAVAAFVAVGGTHRVVNRVSSLSTASADTGVGSRFDIWKAALTTASQHPLLGGGPDTFVETMSRLFAGGVANDAHNWALQLAVTVGPPAAITMTVFLAWVLLSAGRTVVAPGRDSDAALRIACWAAAAGCCVALLFGISQTVSTALLFCCLGVLLNGLGEPFEVPKASIQASGVLMLAIALMVTVLGGVGIAADVQMMQARIAAHETDAAAPQRRVEHARRAVELNPLYERYREERAQAEAAAAK